jgi:thiamine pyrophosphokinase
MIKKGKNLELPINTIISLIPLTDSVNGIFTKGLYYELKNESLFRNSSRGLSNKNVDNFIEINIIDGELIILVNKNK